MGLIATGVVAERFGTSDRTAFLSGVTIDLKRSALVPAKRSLYLHGHQETLLLSSNIISNHQEVGKRILHGPST